MATFCSLSLCFFLSIITFAVHCDGRGRPLAVFPPTCNRIECPSYTVIGAGDGFEIRLINSSMWMTTQPIDDVSFVGATRNGFLQMAKRGLTSQRWTEEDKLILVSAWLNVSKDSETGTSQKRSSFWRMILQYYLEAQPKVARDVETLRKKWDSLSRTVNKFGGCFARVLARGGSGFNEYDFKQQALELYKSETKKDFVDIKCWEVLRNEPKWQGGTQNNKHVGHESVLNVDSNSPVGGATIDQDSSTPRSEERPLGQKAAKRKRSQITEMDDGSRAAYLKNAEEMKLEMKRKNDLMWQHNQILIFKEMNKIATTNISAMTEEQRYLYDAAFQAMASALRAPINKKNDEPAVSLDDDE